MSVIIFCIGQTVQVAPQFLLQLYLEGGARKSFDDISVLLCTNG
jgi:hypothetical protein